MRLKENPIIQTTKGANRVRSTNRTVISTIYCQHDPHIGTKSVDEILSYLFSHWRSLRSHLQTQCRQRDNQMKGTDSAHKSPIKISY